MSVSIILFLQVLCCIGLGSAGLRLLGIDRDLDAVTKIIWSFVVGFGVLGWLLFFFGVFGWFSPAPLLVLLMSGTILTFTLRFDNVPPIKRPDYVIVILITAITIILFFDLIEALPPPSDADTLAYHFALPKQFLDAAKLEFVPRAVDGAVPLLIQMTYIPVLGLGGERALTSWTMVTGWALGLFVYTMCRSHLNGKFSAVFALILLTTPAIIFGAGSGHVEVRNALFASLAAVAVAKALRSGLMRYAFLAGISAGFFVGAKYLGLLFAIAAGLTLLTGVRKIRLSLVFSVGVVIAGSQWYFWNWIHTGDPIFPFLIGNFGIGDRSLWPEGFHEWFKFGFKVPENAVPSNLFWYLAYPIQATFNGFPIFESGRTGLGPFIVLILPFAVFGTWQCRKKIAESPLLSILLIGLLFYTFWFFTGSSQRIRHLIPVYPLFAIPIMVAAVRYAETARSLKALVVAMMVTVFIQIGGHGVFSINFMRYLYSAEDRHAYLERSVPLFHAVTKLNNMIGSDEKVMITNRHLVYHLTKPYFMGHRYNQALVDFRENSLDSRKFLSQLKRNDITHLLILGRIEKTSPPKSMESLIPVLVKLGCGYLSESFVVSNFSSRTLRLDSENKTQARILKIVNYDCFFG